MGFLPVCREDMQARGWDAPDFVLVTGDAYVDHPSFGTAVISRVLEAAGFRVAVLPQPDWRACAPFTAFGRPRLGFLPKNVLRAVFRIFHKHSRFVIYASLCSVFVPSPHSQRLSKFQQYFRFIRKFL